MATSKSTVSLKLLIDTKGNKVLFAEAGKDFVDFLFNLLLLPVGTVVRLLTEHSMVGSLASLYDSIENLSENYLQSNQNKESLLKPKSPTCAAEFPLLLPADKTSVAKIFYMCRHYHQYVADDSRAVCPDCNHCMSRKGTYVAPAPAKEVSASEQGGFVKGVVTYMVMDDLVVKPMSTIYSITLLNKFNIKEVGELEEKIVHLGIAEGLKLLNASLQSKAVLTSVFLENSGA